jgi:hypothetical protein
MNRNCTFLDKTLLIAKFIEDDSKVSLIVRPRRFGKTVNLNMLKDFFSIPIHPDNVDYRRELFKDTKIMKERPNFFDDYFCKYPVIFFSFKVWSYLLYLTINIYESSYLFPFFCQDYETCKTWSMMQDQLCQQLITLYKKHQYVYDKISYSIPNKSRFESIISGKFKHGITNNALLYLSKYLNDFHKSRCIILIDEYDHPLDVAYRNQYYEKAHGFFASLFGALLKVNTYYSYLL